MKESYGEGLANHTGLESCGGDSNVMAEALTEEHTGGLSSSEISSFRVPTMFTEWEGNTRGSVIASCYLDSAESKNLACVEAPNAGTGRS